MVRSKASSKKKVAVACQGGGSQAAFTAGALKRILQDPGLDRDYELVALSGTSGGAVCSLLAWYGLLLHAGDTGHRGTRAADLLTSFWQENSAHESWDRLWVNPIIVWSHFLVDSGLMPASKPLPGVPELVRNRLRNLLESLVRFPDLSRLLREHPDHPTLMCGAADVLSGTFAVFHEACPDPKRRRTVPAKAPTVVSVDTVLASAAVPPLMPAVKVAEGTYWDGLFAHNPPIRALVEREASMRPDETWVIQIDPETVDEVPLSPVGGGGRKFELSSNLSLTAELHWIRQINQWIDEDLLPEASFKIIEWAPITMRKDLADRLDLASKVDRDPRFLTELMNDGEKQVDAFLTARSGRTPTGGLFPTTTSRERPARRCPTSNRRIDTTASTEVP